MARFGKPLIIVLSGIILMGIVYARLAEASNGAPPIPHSVTGQEECLGCHDSRGLNPVPQNHSSYNEGSCLVCHSISGMAGEEPLSDESCQQCHSQPDLSMTFSGGEMLPLYIDPQRYASSVHGDKLLCSDCHSAISDYPHPTREVGSLREYSIAQYDLCKRCHFDNYTKTLDSIHYEMLSGGDLRAPLCTDCHGAHDVALPSQPRAKISQTCSQCHQAISQEYIGSVHGKALLEEDNFDVPVCTDCHQSHTIEDPRTASFRIESVHLCSNCHSNEQLMEKYGISSNVVKTYLNDFHGRTVALVEKQARDIWVEEAVCTDCHGIHDIQAVNSPGSPVIKSNLVTTCGKCHDDVTANFPGAWLSHYEPSISKAPLIFFVRWFYWILIPFILIGLSVHVLLDLWRRITNR
ncbi:MAG: cytochrome c3 family protein [Dehalococcoidales bacterium]|nr:cytochrome c3 family protein [Dehalococcoidales bacterium]